MADQQNRAVEPKPEDPNRPMQTTEDDNGGVQRTERGKEERLETDERLSGKPVESQQPQGPATLTRDKSKAPAENQ
jgi:hypothetical protein